jgi:hypothetical protein
MRTTILITTFLMSVVATAATFHGACGLTGSIQERIQDCAFEKRTSVASVWHLVTRTQSGHEVWGDLGHILIIPGNPITGRLWSDQLVRPSAVYDVSFGHLGKNLYRSYEVFPSSGEGPCTWDETLIFRGNLSDLKWKTPTLMHWQDSLANKIQEVRPEPKGYYWTSTELLPDPFGPRIYKYFSDGKAAGWMAGDRTGGWTVETRYDPASVRCVADL